MSETANGLSKKFDVISLRLTHHNAPITLLETCKLESDEHTLKEIINIDGVDECLVLKTCNRVEVIALGDSKSKEVLRKLWLSKTIGSTEEVKDALIMETSSNALKHLLRLSSGLDSMVVGEDQILGQIQDAYETARKYGAVGALMDLLLFRVLTTGRWIRNSTGISQGAVSIGSVAVKLLEETIGDLNDRNIGIIGAGEIAQLVGNHLTHKKTPKIYIANRTHGRGKDLAEKLSGSAIALSKVGEMLEYVEAVVVATSAPHPVITQEIADEALKRKNTSEKLLIIDLCQPRNVSIGVGDHPQVVLYNIDDLRGISKKNLESRRDAAQKAEEMILTELPSIEAILRRETIEPLITSIWSKADELRLKELDKTFKLLGELDEGERKTVEKLSQVIVTKILHTPIQALRTAATENEHSIVFAAQKLFDLEKGEAQE
jgi:glutamyl-tRNA reductase